MTDKGNYRSIYSTLTDSDDYLCLSKDARLLLLVLKICRFNNMANIFICDEGTIVTLSKMTTIPAKKIQLLINGELTDTHWIAFAYPLLWIINGLKYEPSINLNNSKQKIGVENILKSLPKNQIVHKFCDYYDLAYPYDALSIPSRSTETETYTYTETEKETETEERPDKNLMFKKAWDGLDKTDYEHLELDTIFKMQKNWVANNPAKKNYKKFITNWLNKDLKEYKPKQKTARELFLEDETI